MDSRIPWRCAAVIAATLVFGCGPDVPERQSAVQSRPGNTPTSRAEADRSRDTTVRPPTTVPNPAAPGSAAAPPSATPRLIARAEVRPVADNTVRGIVEFHHVDGEIGGPLTIHVTLMGLAAGPHGLHVHTGTDCAAPGEHLNPQNAPHGPANAASGSRHLGDLGNITADASGTVEETLRDSLLGGDLSFIGKVLVVHEGQDDLSTQPGGGSGEPMGCGTIEPASEDVLSRAGDPSRGV